MPRKGRLSKADRVRESGEAFRGARPAHASVESAINNLEHRGLDLTNYFTCIMYSVGVSDGHAVWTRTFRFADARVARRCPAVG